MNIIFIFHFYVLMFRNNVIHYIIFPHNFQLQAGGVQVLCVRVCVWCMLCLITLTFTVNTPYIHLSSPKVPASVDIRYVYVLFYLTLQLSKNCIFLYLNTKFYVTYATFYKVVQMGLDETRVTRLRLHQ